MNKTTPLFLDLRRAESEYPFGRDKFKALIKEGRLPAYRLDGKFLIRRADIERLLTSNPVKADTVSAGATA